MDLLDNYYKNKKIKTILGKGTYFNGDLIFNDSIKINGTFIGNINSKGLLIVGEDSHVKADVAAESIVVLGTIDGDVYADEKVEMMPTGRVYGNIKARKIKISDGVIFNGSCEMVT